MLQPFGRGAKVFLANNDYVALDVRYKYGDWAEETLLQSERALAIREPRNLTRTNS